MPVDPTPVTTPPSNSIVSTITGAVSGGTASVISGFFGQIPWVRIGEILLGLLLLNVGIAQLSGLGPSITKAVTKASF